jgi:hypothetical protein
VDQFDADDQECQELLDDPPPSLNAQQAEQYFDALLEAAECISDLGYPVSNPPSRGAAIEALTQPIIDLDGWPYDDALRSAESGAERDEVYVVCPQPDRPY